ncbi:MAG: hypothetical protein DMF00_00685 [Verrucomicrobia bacterium]|nr:MAG: hypothetical protein DMF00_00685 [Verrucomicrobiota bacterium]
MPKLVASLGRQETAGVPCGLIKRFGSVDDKDRVGKRRSGDTAQTAMSFFQRSPVLCRKRATLAAIDNFGNDV